MGSSLPEMGGWDAIFDETYLRTYRPFVDEERTRTEALGAVSLARLGPGAEILDCPCGFGRHSLVLAQEGYRVTGLDRSETLLAEAERQRGGAEQLCFVRGDYRQLPFEDESFDAVLNLFSALGYLERDEDIGVLREFRRVLRPGGRLIIETAHRDAMARFTRANPHRSWEHLPDGSLFLHEHESDWLAGTSSALHLIVEPSGERIERRYRFHFYSVKEWAEMLREAGFEDVDAFGGWDEAKPATPDDWRLILRAA
jgi:ubiquinone/menaquinone biosynthesis C-methylase UbiE